MWISTLLMIVISDINDLVGKLGEGRVTIK